MRNGSSSRTHTPLVVAVAVLDVVIAVAAVVAVVVGPVTAV